MVAECVVMAPVLDDVGGVCGRPPSAALGYSSDSVLSAATGSIKDRDPDEAIRVAAGRVPGADQRPSAGRPDIEQTQPGRHRGAESAGGAADAWDPDVAVAVDLQGARRSCAAALTARGWPISATTVGRLLRGLGCRLHALQKARKEAQRHPRSQRPVRTYRCDGRRVHGARADRDLGRHEEEGTGRRFKKMAGANDRLAGRPASCRITTFLGTRSARQLRPAYDMARNEALGQFVGREHGHAGLCRRVDPSVVDHDRT